MWISLKSLFFKRYLPTKVNKPARKHSRKVLPEPVVEIIN